MSLSFEDYSSKKSSYWYWGRQNYTLYDVGTDNTQFVQAGYKSEKRIKGFGRLWFLASESS